MPFRTPTTPKELQGLGIASPGLAEVLAQNQKQPAEGEPIYGLNLIPKAIGAANFGVLLTSTPFSGTYDPYGVIGFNPEGTMIPSQGGAGPSWAMAFEYDYLFGGVHQQEWYLNHNSADKTTIQYFRPIYVNIRYSPDAANKQRAQIDFNIGDSTLDPGQWRIKSGSTTLISIDAQNYLVNVPTATFQQSLSVIKTGFQSKMVLGDNLNGTYGVTDYLGGLNHSNFRVCVQNNVNNGLEITPSDILGGSNFSTPLIVVDAVRLNVGIGIGAANPNAAAILELASTTKAFILPRMTTAQKNAIVSPPEGSKVYDITLHKECVRGAAAWETVTSV